MTTLSTTTIEGAAARVLASDCQRCPLMQSTPAGSPNAARGFAGRCLMGRGEGDQISWTIRDIPCLDRSRIIRVSDGGSP